jgi:DNA-binding response OmpR family regulator
MGINILIVEDESIVALEIEEYLKLNGYNVVDICFNAKSAVEVALTKEIDLIIMDISLHNSSGIDAAIEIKKRLNIPIIYLTSYVDEEVINNAIATNPSAYLTKPFDQNELLASIKIALISKDRFNLSDKKITLDNTISYLPKKSLLIVNSKEIHLNIKEKKLLELFLKRVNQIITYESVEYIVWQEEIVSDNARRVLVSRLRAKLDHKFITTYSKEGYIFTI